jgi:hypothetical protein
MIARMIVLSKSEQLKERAENISFLAEICHDNLTNLEVEELLKFEKEVAIKNQKTEIKQSEKESLNSRLNKAQKYMEWCKWIGIISPKVEFPAVFKNGLMGVRALKDIEHRQMIMAIPMKSILTTEMAKECPFGEILTLVVYLFHEKQKGDKSKIAAWLAMMGDDELFA